MFTARYGLGLYIERSALGCKGLISSLTWPALFSMFYSTNKGTFHVKMVISVQYT